MPELFKIAVNLREFPLRVVRPDDFALEPYGEIESGEILRDPRFSLYCFDPEKDAAVFVKCPDPSALDAAPFYYQAQIETAYELALMPMAAFHRLAQQIPLPPKGFIFVHSVGRCGSTLLSKALAVVPGVHSLSEPDDFTQLINIRNEGQFDDEQVMLALKSSARWRSRPASDRVAIKTRSEVMVLADLMAAVFPDARHIFLYRNGISWMQSVFGVWPKDRDLYDEKQNAAMIESWSKTIPLLGEYRMAGKPINAAQIRAAAWITCMERYFTLFESGIPICAARFEDLTAAPLQVLEQLFSFCGFQEVDWDAVKRVLGKDSQEGTIFDRENRRANPRILPDEFIAQVSAMIAARPLLQSPNVLLPKTLNINATAKPAE